MCLHSIVKLIVNKRVYFMLSVCIENETCTSFEIVFIQIVQWYAQTHFISVASLVNFTGKVSILEYIIMQRRVKLITIEMKNEKQNIHRNGILVDLVRVDNRKNDTRRKEIGI